MELTFRLCPDDLIALEKLSKGENQIRNLIAMTLIGSFVWVPFLFFITTHVLNTPNIHANFAKNGIQALLVFAPFILPVFLFYLLWFMPPLF